MTLLSGIFPMYCLLSNVMQESKKYFNPGIGPGPKKLCNRKLLSERVLRPSLDKYRLFVQSTGSGARHLARGSILLYEVFEILSFNFQFIVRLLSVAVISTSSTVTC